MRTKPASSSPSLAGVIAKCFLSAIAGGVVTGLFLHWSLGREVSSLDATVQSLSARVEKGEISLKSHGHAINSLIRNVDVIGAKNRIKLPVQIETVDRNLTSPSLPQNIAPASLGIPASGE